MLIKFLNSNINKIKKKKNQNVSTVDHVGSTDHPDGKYTDLENNFKTVICKYSYIYELLTMA